jgi:hypothetical protein
VACVTVPARVAARKTLDGTIPRFLPPHAVAICPINIEETTRLPVVPDTGYNGAA